MTVSAVTHYGDISPNSLRILTELMRRGAMSRGDIGSVTSLSSTSVHRAVSELAGKELVDENHSFSGKQGRPQASVALRASAVVAVGVDIGSYNTRVGVVDWVGRVLHEERRPTSLTPPDEVIRMIFRALADCGDSPVAGIGLGISGLVDYRAGLSVFCPNIPQWNNLPIVQAVEQATGIKTFVDTSARCMALAETTYGCGRDVDDLVFVSVGQSVSAGIIVSGSIFRGSNCFSGEVGHVTAVTGGYKCTCGNEGCLENYVTESQVYLLLKAKLRETRSHSVLRELVGTSDDIDAATFRRALELGDRLAHEHLIETGSVLGTTLANLVNVLDPQLLVLGGGLIELYPEVVDEVRRSIKIKALNPIQSRMQVSASKLGWTGAVAGASLLAILPFLGHLA